MAIDNAERTQLRSLIDFDDMRECIKSVKPEVRLGAYLRLCEYVFPRVSPVQAETTNKVKTAQDAAIERLFKQ